MSFKLIKSSAIAVVASVFGFAAVPAFAQNSASVTQTSDQSVTQEGNGNFAMQGNVQTGVINQSGSPYGNIQCFVAPCPGTNDATVQQSNQQNIDQKGNGNQAIQGSVSNANVNQGSLPYSFPYYPFGNNSAAVTQSNGQGIHQVGNFNGAAQGNAASATVNQP